MIQTNDVVLFQGDSITDCGRSREVPSINSGLGGGYAHLVACTLLAQRPNDNLSFLNRGISGDRITSLMARWKADALNLKPTVVSILIGINDIWHEFGSKTGTNMDKYERFYRELLQDTRAALPGVRLVLCDPFVLRCGVVQPEWLPVLAQEQALVQTLATEIGATVVAFQKMFDAAAQKTPPAYWSGDGVHPTLAGHMLMAQEWIKTVAGK